MPPKPLLVEELSMADLLARAGLPAATARVFAALARGGGHTASDLAAATGLSRQDAGDAARELELHGLARVEKVPSGGRPTHRYHFARDALPAFLARRRDALRAELDALDAVEARFGRAI